MVTIRLAQTSDAEALQSLFARFIKAAQWLPPGSDQGRNFARITQGEQVYVAVSEAGEILGAVTVWQPESFIHCLFVAAEHQGQGVGTKLLESLADWLPFPWRLKCVATNRSALRFYQRRGWRTLETGRGDDGIYFLLGRDADGFDSA